jgi:hypothetical protein
MNSEATLPFAGALGGDMDVIRRLLITTAFLAVLIALVLWAYAGWGWAVGLAGGAILGMANIVFLTALVREIVTPGERCRGRIAALIAIKVPVVCGGLIALLIWRALPITGVVIGFSLILIVITLKAAGRALLGCGLFSDPRQPRHEAGKS